MAEQVFSTSFGSERKWYNKYLKLDCCVCLSKVKTPAMKNVLTFIGTYIHIYIYIHKKIEVPAAMFCRWPL